MIDASARFRHRHHFSSNRRSALVSLVSFKAGPVALSGSRGRQVGMMYIGRKPLLDTYR